jgi:hypothetical protein
MSKTRTYRIWAGIKTRCLNQNDPNYPRYGSRGITVCDEWRQSFESFRDYVSRLPNFDNEDYSLDRINNDGNYEPGNVRWATDKEQCRNMRVNHLVTYNGKTQCVADWADEIGLKSEMIFNRLKLGWTIERALTQKPRRSPRKPLVEFHGEEDSLGHRNSQAREP